MALYWQLNCQQFSGADNLWLMVLEIGGTEELTDQQQVTERASKNWLAYIVFSILLAICTVIVGGLTGGFASGISGSVGNEAVNAVAEDLRG